ncbi:uroporphyrinogen-III synthase [Moraxella oblonga]|uniref:uroporphyrinogen-III synthase n=1 Tax=Moraxella oblonga TaxID=200413 RepID=UPI000832BAEC|nr:uroporphyrinogen-III synthase [Moraxella oblonga]
MNLFINTRPNHKANTLTLDMPSVHLPLLSIVPFDSLTDMENMYWATFIQGNIDTVVVVSVEAVRCAISFLKQQNIHHASNLPHHPTMIAVGQPTKDALVEFGFTVITPAEFGLPMSNEGMIQLPHFTHMGQHDSIMIWRGVGGRRLLHDMLVQRGVKVLPIEFYERQTPNDMAMQFEHFYQNLPKNAHLYVLISSGMSLDVWRQFDKQQHNATFLALGERLSKLAKLAYPDSMVVCINDLHNNTLLTTLQKFTKQNDEQPNQTNR